MRAVGAGRSRGGGTEQQQCREGLGRRHCHVGTSNKCENTPEERLEKDEGKKEKQRIQRRKRTGRSEENGNEKGLEGEKGMANEAEKEK